MRRVIITGRNSTVPHHPFTSSGMMPVARAAGDLPRYVGPKTPAIMRRVPGSSGSKVPAAKMSRGSLPGTFADKVIEVVTVILGMTFLALFGLLFLVLA